MRAELSPEFLAALGVIVVVVAAALWSTRRDAKKDRGTPSVAPAPSAGAPVRSGGGAPAPSARVALLDDEPVSFADVAGLDDAIEELRDITHYLAHPARYHRLGAILPKGILLCGDPGNGKTLLARALAGEADVPFYSVSAAGFVEQFVGLGAARIREVFDEVRAGPRPAIVFIDELDAIGAKRTGGPAGDREFDHTLNQLLVELDGFAATEGVVIIGATNREELLDDALVRPGRFDRRVRIERPDLEGRAAILALHAAGRPVSGRVDWDDVAAATAGLSGAELAGLVNDACLLAARRNRELVGHDDVAEAVARTAEGSAGRRPVIDDWERNLLAHHEAGHAVLALLLDEAQTPHRISIVAGWGSTAPSPWSVALGNETLTQRQLRIRLVVLLAGRAAELLTFGEPSTRAGDDLEAATDLARAMVERWGMAGWGGPSDDEVSSVTTADAAVANLLVQAEAAARSMLADHAVRLRAVAAELARHEVLTVDEVRAVAGLAPRAVATLAPVTNIRATAG
ncbi:MAG: AAA family ATPase [Acidimicrobiales bacterium]